MQERFTITELAKFWGVSERTIERHIDTGRLQAVNLGTGGKRHLRVTADAVRAFEEKNSTEARVKARKNKMRGVKQFYSL